jgi:hypothetical protein
MSELARHEYYVESFCNQKRSKSVTEAVQRQTTILTDACPTNSQAERFSDLAVVKAATGGCCEHEVIRSSVRTSEPASTQEPYNRRGEYDLPSASLRLESGVLPVARQLAMYSQDVSLEIHVGPGQAESFADPQSGEREQLEQLPVTPRLIEYSCERHSLENADPSGGPAWLSPGSKEETGFRVSQPRRTANRQTAFSVMSAMTAVVGASTRSLAADHSAT